MMVCATCGEHVEGVVPAGIEEKVVDRLLDGVVEELLEKDRPGHAIELFGRAAEGGMEMLAKGPDRHQFEDPTAEQTRPIFPQALEHRRAEHALRRVEEGFLSRIDRVSHGRANLGVSKDLRRLASYTARPSIARKIGDKSSNIRDLVSTFCVIDF